MAKIQRRPKHTTIKIKSANETAIVFTDERTHIVASQRVGELANLYASGINNTNGHEGSLMPENWEGKLASYSTTEHLAAQTLLELQIKVGEMESGRSVHRMEPKDGRGIDYDDADHPTNDTLVEE